MRFHEMRFHVLVALTLLLAPAARAQDRGSLEPATLPPLAHPDDPSTAAKELFGRKTYPAAMTPHVVGFYARGCLAGGEALPFDGPTWQVMRLSRNRNWGHPALIEFLERFSQRAAHTSHWPGVLVGDMSQPRGGPMRNGHSSHQVGLDADIWLRPMPRSRLSRAEREEMSSINVVAEDRRDVDQQKWSDDDVAVIKAAAEDRAVQRIFVNPAIKKALCRDVRGDRSWLGKVRPYWGHDYHFHIRLYCPAGESTCESQPEIGSGDGCDASLASWFRESILHPRPAAKPAKPKPPMTMAALPAECRRVLESR